MPRFRRPRDPAPNGRAERWRRAVPAMAVAMLIAVLLALAGIIVLLQLAGPD